MMNKQHTIGYWICPRFVKRKQKTKQGDEQFANA